MQEGSPSVTAQKVAMLRLSFERVFAPYGNPEAEDALARDVSATTAVDGQTLLSDYLAARTRFFDRVVVAALDRGITQAVIVGAGYDGRALRYAKPGVQWFELDHPATQSDKRSRLDRLGVDASLLRFVEADFATDDVAVAMCASGFDPNRPTIFICEGVVVYLERDVVTALLTSIRSVAADESRLAISFAMTPETDEAEARQVWMRDRVAAVGEPERDRLTPDELARLLASTGWKDETTSPRAHRAGLVVLRPM